MPRIGTGVTDTRAAFEPWASQARIRLRRTAYLLCGDWHLAEDLTQDTLVRVYAAWHRIVAADPDGYARTTLVNAYRSTLRRPWRRQETVTAVLPESISALDRTAQSDQRAALVAALDALGRSQREVIVLRYWEDLSVAEVADLLRISTGTVKSQAARGLGRLRVALAAVELTTDVGER